MSLTSLLKKDQVFQTIVQDSLPQREHFVSTGDFPAFSHNPRLLVSDNNRFSELSGLVGTASDYAFRFIIAKHTYDVTFSVLNSLIAKKGVEVSLNPVHQLEYEMSIDCIKAYILSPSLSCSHIINACYVFAKLEMIYRSKDILSFDVSPSFFADDPLTCEIEDEILQMCQLFEKTFLSSGLVLHSSFVKNNPTFSHLTIVCRGADADIQLDGTLYDFKSSIHLGYHWKEVAQVYCYFLFDCLERIYHEIIAPKYDPERIHLIAFYRSRYGIIEHFDTSLIPKDDLALVLTKIKEYLFRKDYSLRIHRLESIIASSDNNEGSQNNQFLMRCKKNYEELIELRNFKNVVTQNRIKEWVHSL